MKIVAKVQGLSVEVNGQQIIAIDEPITRVLYTPPPRKKLTSLPPGFAYIDVDLKTTAKLIRQDLKREYRLTTFSVRTQRMSGGMTAINVRWQPPGPTMEEVQALLDKYRGSVPNFPDDGYELVAVEIEDRWYHFGADFISCERMPQFIEGTARAL